MRGRALGAAAAAVALIAECRRRRSKLAACSPKADDRDEDESATATKKAKARARKKLGAGYRNVILRHLVPQCIDQLGWLALLCLGRTLLNDRLSRIQGWLFQATFEKDAPFFFKLIVEDVVLNLVMSCWKATIEYRMGALALRWRTSINDLIATDYFKNITYYKVSFVDKTVQNPEQVIVGDTEVVTTELADMAVLWIGAIIDGSYFSYQLAQATSVRWASIPISYIAFAIVTSQSVSPNFIKLFSLKTKAETSLRAAFSNLRTNVEAITAFGGGEREQSLITARSKTAFSHTRQLLFTQYWFGIIEDFIAKYCVTTMAVGVIMGPLFSTKTGRNIKTNAEVLSKMRYLTSLVVFQMTAVGGLARVAQKSMKLSSYIDRVGELLAVLKKTREQFVSQHSTSVVAGKQIEFKGVEVVTPTGNSLVKDLTFTITPGTNMLIVGPNGAGKSSIFRCLGSLWTVKQGTIVKPSINDGGLCDDVFYLPQKTYNVVGDLRDQLTYPANSKQDRDAITDAELAALLRMVDLEYLLGRHRNTAGTKVNWESELSLGETQRLAMARLFYHNPTYAILDECTSGVSTDMEERLYRICAERGITCVTISHRPALEAFHHTKLALNGKGGYDVGSIGSEGGAGFTPGVPPKYDAVLNGAVGAAATTSLKKMTQAATYPPLELPLLGKSSGLLANFHRLGEIVWATTKDLTTRKLSLLTAIVVGRVFLTDRIARLNGLCFKALLSNDLKGFKMLLLWGIAQSGVQAVLAPTLGYMAKTLALDWREAIQKHIFKLYFADKAYYKLGNLYHLVEDADHRLTEDLDKLSTELANIFPDIVKPLVDISFFTYQAWRILGFKSTALLYSYMVLGFGVLRVVTPAFGALVERSQELTSSFRYVHTRLRTHAESVAFFGGDDVEGNICTKQYSELVEHQQKYLSVQWTHSIFDDFIIKQLPPIVTWVLTFAYVIRLAKVKDIYSDNGGQISFDMRYLATTVSHVFLAFGELLDLYKRVVEISGYASRVIEVERGLLAIQAKQDANTQEFGAVVPSDDVVFDAVDVVTPTGTCLASKVVCTVTRTENLLVTGPNVSGKSSLFRVLGGLWPIRCGRLLRPSSPGYSEIKNVFMVPQRPYNAIGTLGEQLTYPESPDLTDPKVVALLAELLERVGLSYLVARYKGWNATANWVDVLSLGEQQRLGMARLFYHKPRFAVLDQCTDAVSVDVEEALYDQARKLGVTIITISQRPGLMGHHEQQLSLLDGNGGWSLKKKKGGAWVEEVPVEPRVRTQ